MGSSPRITRITRINTKQECGALPRRHYEEKTMTKSESITHLAAALAKAQAEMPVAAFDATNPFLKSKYATLGAVIQASRPILAKHKLSLVQFPVNEIRHLTPSLSPIEAEREKA